MRRLTPLAALTFAGCSTAPVTNLLDWARPSRPGDSAPGDGAPPPRGRDRIRPPADVPLGDPGPPPKPRPADGL